FRTLIPCFCGATGIPFIPLSSENAACVLQVVNMTPEELFHLPLNIYIIILGVGLFILMLCLLFCCSMSRHRRRRRGEKFGYNEVVLKGMGKKLSLLGQTCAVCLEEFCSRDELGVCPCSHAFHKKCLLKWLEIRSVCPMCNKPV
uniref:Si:dkey-51a16.9 n=1 Tax=Tetraodon nigroviridis TaxID=99883 RepID=H3CWY5_TETNG